MLTRKDFKAVTEIIADRLVDIADTAAGFAVRNNVDIMARRFADYFATQNPQFDRERFMKACELGGAE